MLLLMFYFSRLIVRVCCRDEQRRMSIRSRLEPFKISVRSEAARKESLLSLRVIFLDDSEQTFEVEVRPKEQFRKLNLCQQLIIFYRHK